VRRIIIRNESKVDDILAVHLVSLVMGQGLVSVVRGEPAYCLGTRIYEHGVSIIASPTKSGHSFLVLDDSFPVPDEHA
jgi:hypothetical protein